MKKKWFQLTKLQIDAKTKKFTGEISFIWIRESFIECIGQVSYNERTIAQIVCSDGRSFCCDIHPADLINAMDADVVTTASIMSAFDSKKST